MEGGSTTSLLAFQPSSSTLSVVRATKHPPNYPPGAGASPTAQSGELRIPGCISPQPAANAAIAGSAYFKVCTVEAGECVPVG